ncbi:MAG: hypothetical protein HQM09_19365 [Candidatus Riflebacteria bacterium]|nr:hypothetical protein [Candidatus Riflebacteria bacterium]
MEPLVSIAKSGTMSIELEPCGEAKKKAAENHIKIISLINAIAHHDDRIYQELNSVFPKLNHDKVEHDLIQHDLKLFLTQFNHGVNSSYAYTESILSKDLTPYIYDFYNLNISFKDIIVEREVVTKSEFKLVAKSDSELTSWYEIRALLFTNLYMAQFDNYLSELIGVCPVCSHVFEIKHSKHWCDTPACTERFQHDHFAGELPDRDEFPLNINIHEKYEELDL